jgi:hypothetical protein
MADVLLEYRVKVVKDLYNKLSILFLHGGSVSALFLGRLTNESSKALTK